MAVEDSNRPETPISVARWPTEIPLLVFVALAAAGIWMLLAFSLIGIVYAVILGAFFFVAHVVFVTYVRGSAIRLGPKQFPELYKRVVELAGKAGLDPVPAAYILQAGGSLNALATRFLRARFIVLFSDLLEACKDDEEARDMVIGHELGHIRAGHLNWLWLLTPGLFVPFLGSAYSRAREYTCDRYGAALCGDKKGALTGLAILAAGGRHGPDVNLKAFSDQARDLNTGWMTLGSWLSGYPPLCDRVTALEPELKTGRPIATRGPVRAILILASVFLLPIIGGGILASVVIGRLGSLADGFVGEIESGSTAAALEVAPGEARTRAEEDAVRFAAMLSIHSGAGGSLPEDSDELYEIWADVYPAQEPPTDPFDGFNYGYHLEDDGYVVSSVGPDGEYDTDDDIEFSFATPFKGAGSP